MPCGPKAQCSHQPDAGNSRWGPQVIPRIAPAAPGSAADRDQGDYVRRWNTLTGLPRPAALARHELAGCSRSVLSPSPCCLADCRCEQR